jgi:hypothetical protein
LKLEFKDSWIIGIIPSIVGKQFAPIVFPCRFQVRKQNDTQNIWKAENIGWTGNILVAAIMVW